MTEHIFKSLEKEMLKFRENFGSREMLRQIYFAAIHFFTRSIWRDASYFPNDGEPILVRYGSKVYTGKFVELNFSGNNYIYSLKTESGELISVYVRKWASVEDILPKEEEDFK